MSILPMIQSNASARAAAPARADRAVRDIQAERPESPEKTDRTERTHTPPDFAMLLALLGGTNAPSPARDAAHPESLLQSNESEPTVLLENAELAIDAENSEASVAANARARAGGVPVGSVPIGTSLADSEQRALARSIRADALRVAQAVIADTNRAAGFASDESGMSPTQSAEGLSDNQLLSLAERARSGAVGELLARGDSQAAGLRSTLDAVLDMAGTPRGRALAEATRPAFAAAVTRSAGDVSTAVRTVDALSPGFKGRLERVMDRMRDEFGHDVQVVETVRSTERQDHLYAQGRTRQGPIVTWTTESAHLSGEAADVIIDGKWHNPQGYARLHEVAKEEGLRTLGMRDPGHLEMPGAARGEGSASAIARDGAAGFDRGMSHSGVAGVASVARVAQVATVAQVARPGGSGMPARAAASRLSLSGEATLQVAPNAAGGAASGLLAHDHSTGGLLARGQSESQHNAPKHSSRDKNRDSLSDRERSAISAVERASERGIERAGERSAIGGEALSAIGQLGSSVERVLDGGVPRVTAPVGSTASSRAEAIAVLREDAPARSINSLTMQIDSPNGAEEIRVSLRGGTVGAQISTGDNALADRLRLQTADLADALSRHGLENEPLRVQQNARAHDNDATRQALADRGELLKAGSSAAGQQSGQHTGQQTSQQHQQEPGARDRGAARQHPERDARDARDDTHQQGRRNDRQENR